MATIESINATFFPKPLKQASNGSSLPKQGNRAGESLETAMPGKGVPPQPTGAQEVKVPQTEERPPDTGSGKVAVKPREQMSITELEEMLRKVNLTFDLFEIQAKFSVNADTGEISVQIVNQRTGEVIRSIPPYDVPEMVQSIGKQVPYGLDGSILTDVLA